MRKLTVITALLALVVALPAVAPAKNVVIKRKGVVVFRGSRITRPPSGSFSVNRRIGNAAGPDRIVATARSVVGGGVCRGVVTV